MGIRCARRRCSRAHVPAPTGVLRELDLSENAIKASGAAALAEALRRNRSLSALSLQYNGICEGAKPLAQALVTNSALRTLDLRRNDLAEAEVRALGKALASNGVLPLLVSKPVSVRASTCLCPCGRPRPCTWPHPRRCASRHTRAQAHCSRSSSASTRRRSLPPPSRSWRFVPPLSVTATPPLPPAPQQRRCRS